MGWAGLSRRERSNSSDRAPSRPGRTPQRGRSEDRTAGVPPAGGPGPLGRWRTRRSGEAEFDTWAGGVWRHEDCFRIELECAFGVDRTAGFPHLLAA
jgi:hypothetical protein